MTNFVELRVESQIHWTFIERVKFTCYFLLSLFAEFETMELNCSHETIAFANKNNIKKTANIFPKWFESIENAAEIKKNKIEQNNHDRNQYIPFHSILFHISTANATMTYILVAKNIFRMSNFYGLFFFFLFGLIWYGRIGN